MPGHSRLRIHANDAKGRRDWTAAFTAGDRLITIRTGRRHRVYSLRFAATELSQQLDEYENFDANFNEDNNNNDNNDNKEDEGFC
jgi:hypothetical protein